MKDGLYVNPNTFLSFSELAENSGNEMLTELYSSGGLAGGFDPVGWLGLLPDPDPVLQKTGDGVQVLRSLLGDDKVISSIQNRKLGTLKKQDFLYEPGTFDGKEADKASIALCADLSSDLKNVKLYNVFSQVLDAPYYGQTPVEIIWKSEGGKLRIADLKPRPVEWFGYNAKHEPVFSGSNMGTAEPVIDNKLVIASHFPDATNPYGLRLLSRCLWPVAIKKGGIQFWTILCERFGMPWVIGKVAGNVDDRREALGQLSSMVQDAVAVVSSGTTVDVHTLSGKGGDLHPALIRYCDRAIARALQGQNLTSEEGSTGTRAESQTSLEALGDFREADEYLLVAFMNELGRVYQRVNSAAALSPVFRFCDPEDYDALADLDVKLYGMNVRWNKIHYEKRYQLSPDEFEILSDSPSGTTTETNAELSFSDAGTDKTFTGQQSALETLSDELMAIGNASLEDNEKQIIEAILSSENYEDALNRLLELYPSLDVDRLAGVLEKGILNAGLFGAYTADQGASDGEN